MTTNSACSVPTSVSWRSASMAMWRALSPVALTVLFAFAWAVAPDHQLVIRVGHDDQLVVAAEVKLAMVAVGGELTRQHALRVAKVVAHGEKSMAVDTRPEHFARFRRLDDAPVTGAPSQPTSSSRHSVTRAPTAFGSGPTADLRSSIPD